MALLSLTSPHGARNNSVQKVMLTVAASTLPGIAALTLFFGWGTLINLFLAIIFALSAEAIVLKLRQKPITFYLSDGSALVTGLLLGLSIPPTSPWWMTLIGASFSIVIVKQLYGGIGNNPFNPAMAGYVLLLISFPVQMTSWLPPSNNIDLWGSLQVIFTGSLTQQTIDAFTMATPLDSLKSATREWGILTTDLHNRIYESYPVFDFKLPVGLLGTGWTGVNLAFLAGGLFLLHKRIISWHIPVSMLIGLGLMASIFQLLDLSNASPLFHLLSGGTMLGAFFIATDPVSAATSRYGRIIFGFTIGVTVYVIRTWGGYPDAIAFAVLLLNLAAPTIDYYTQPRTYGHARANRGISKSGG